MKRGELDDLVAFATIARTRSFTRAAAELSLSPSALSHAMRGLEVRLGVPLLARTTRSVAPTSAGERLLRDLEPALKEVETGLEALSDWRGEPSGTLRITTSQFAAHTVLAPVLPTFLLKNPKISVEVCVDPRLADLVRDGFDAGIRWSEKVNQDMVSVRIGPNTRMIAVAAPDYLERHPRPQSPAELEHHNCINYRLHSEGGYFTWMLKRDGKEVRCRVAGQLILDDPDLAETLIKAGAGLGLMLEQKAAPHLKAGRLIQVLDEWCVPFGGLHLYYPSSRHVSPALLALIEVLRLKPQGPRTAGFQANEIQR